MGKRVERAKAGCEWRSAEFEERCHGSASKFDIDLDEAAQADLGFEDEADLVAEERT